MTETFRAASSTTISEYRAAEDRILLETVEQAVAHSQGSSVSSLPLTAVKEGISFMLRMLMAAIEVGTIELLENDLEFALGRDSRIEVPPSFISRTLRFFEETLIRNLSPQSVKEIHPYVEWMIEEVDQHPVT